MAYNTICIHAISPDLGFLNDVRNSIAALLGKNFALFRLGDIPSHSTARRAIVESGPSFVIIFSHGGSDYIRGGEYYHKLTGETRVVERFLERSDLKVFQGKIVFCMSCNSIELADDILKAGAVAFVGFDQIPFHRLDEDENVISDHEFNQQAQQLIAGAVNFCINNFISGRLSLDQSVDFTKLWICQNVVNFVRNKNNGKQRHNVAALLLRMKDGLNYVGLLGVRFQ